MDRFNDRYRVASARLSSWNYSWNAAYFVTICTKDRECYFGQIDNQILRLNSLGIIAGHCWNQIPHHFPFVKLGQFIVMPNHVHGIIVIH
jgi:REP element-mobilizing transposase RayT